jgi:hypothetical protein
MNVNIPASWKPGYGERPESLLNYINMTKTTRTSDSWSMAEIIKKEEE